jgi:hypothetical protein
VLISGFSNQWKKYAATLHPKDTDAKARLAVLVEGKGTLDVDMASCVGRRNWPSTFRTRWT